MIRRPPVSTRTDTLFPYTTLFRSRGVDGAFQQASVMCREGGASSFGIPKSRACAIGLSGGRLVRAGTLRLNRAEAVENAGMLGIYAVAADPGCPRERIGCGFREGFAGQACKGVPPARTLLCPPS